MNYLAHAFLSNNNTDLLIGNFIADHLRGNDFKNYSPTIIEGIYLHRRIDTFTDSHTNFKIAKRIFYNGYERYSGVLIDIYFDHLLAKNFSMYSTIPLKYFCDQVYQTYIQNQALLPKSSSNFLDYVLKNNIYYEYSSIEGIEKVLFHLSHRIKHNVMLDRSVVIFKEHEEELTANFEIFFKDAIKEF
ncbi:MAG: ACP phosphodiesterase [Bacteroidia bacterium]